MITAALACAPASDVSTAPPAAPPEALHADESWLVCTSVAPGGPAGVFADFSGTVLVADASPSRLIAFTGDGRCQEFQIPGGVPAFRPSDVAVRGFFVYAVDETDRLLLRWDSSGSYRDVLLNFEDLRTERRISPYSIDVDASGRLAITDVENHKVLVLDTYLDVDVAFGNYGSFDGQLDTPQGVSWTPRGELLVADSGNGRLQVFSDAGAFRRAIPGPGVANPMRRPRRAVMAQDGTIFVADPRARRVFVIAPDGSAIRSLATEGPATFQPSDVALARDGRLFVTDTATKSLLVFKVM